MKCMKLEFHCMIDLSMADYRVLDRLCLKSICKCYNLMSRLIYRGPSLKHEPISKVVQQIIRKQELKIQPSLYSYFYVV
jgi:hypothetical protein